MHVLVRHVPRPEVHHAGLQARADALPLPDGVEPEAPVPADGLPMLVDDLARRRAQVVPQEVVELQLAKKADALFSLVLFADGDGDGTGFGVSFCCGIFQLIEGRFAAERQRSPRTTDRVGDKKRAEVRGEVR